MPEPARVAAVMFMLPPAAPGRPPWPFADRVPFTVTAPEAAIIIAPPPSVRSAPLPNETGLVREPYVLVLLPPAPP